MSKPVEVTTPGKGEVRVARTFDAPAHLVFEFYTTPAYVRQWMLGPPGWSMPVCEIDLRVGGRYRHRWRNDEDGTEFGAEGEYREVAVPERIVHTERMEGFDAESLCTLIFEEKDGRTTLVTTMRFESDEARDQALGTGMTDGMAQSFDLLEALLAERSA